MDSREFGKRTRHEVIKPLNTAIIMDPDILAAIPSRLEPGGVYSLYDAADLNAESPLQASRLICTAETLDTSMHFQGSIDFVTPPTNSNELPLRKLKELLRNEGVIDSHQATYGPVGNKFNFRLSADHFIVIRINQSDVSQWLQLDIIPEAIYLNGEKAEIFDERLHIDFPDTLRKFLACWSLAHDAITQTYDVGIGPRTLQLNLNLSPSKTASPASGEMPTREIFDENTVRFDDIAGYEDTKDRLRELALLHQEPVLAARIGLTKTHGVLLHGVGGTAKTTLLHAFANEINADTVELTVSDIVAKWVGDSARNIDKFFKKLKDRPDLTVVIMDEFNSIGARSDTVHTQERIDVVNRLKEHIIDITKNHPNIILTGATNDIDLVDPNLIRPGRFMPIEVKLPSEREQGAILALMLGKIGTLAAFGAYEDPSLPTLDIALDVNPLELAAAGPGLTGAHFEEILESIKLRRAYRYLKTREMPPISQAELLEEIRRVATNLEN